jgi:hypothetical protein
LRSVIDPISNPKHKGRLLPVGSEQALKFLLQWSLSSFTQ